MPDAMSDLYLSLVLANHKPNAVNVPLCQSQLLPQVREWAGNQLLNFFVSGSFAKGTAVKGTADVDFFISIDPNCTSSLNEIYDTLLAHFSNNGFAPRRQNVSVGLNMSGISVDLTPGKKDPGNSNYHKLYSNRSGSWKQTNIQLQVNQVLQSQRGKEIRLAKIWRTQCELDFPSYYLETAVIEALLGCSTTDLSGNFDKVLKYFANYLPSRRIVDITNSANVLSDDVSAQGKNLIAGAAQRALRANTWQGRIS